MHAILPETGEQLKNSVAIEQQQRKVIKTDTLTIHKGHRIWELCIKTLEFEEIKLDRKKAKLNGGVTTDVKMKDGHIYCAALNRRNAEKEFNNMLIKLLGISNATATT